jgi:hypothetical protein
MVWEKGNNLLLLNEVKLRIRLSGLPMHVGATGKTGSGGGFRKTAAQWSWVGGDRTRRRTRARERGIQQWASRARLSK